MAAARDQAARVLRPEPDDTAEGPSVREPSAAPAESPRAPVAEDTVARRSPESPDKPMIEKPAAVSAAPKSGKRKLVLMVLFTPHPHQYRCGDNASQNDQHPGLVGRNAKKPQRHTGIEQQAEAKEGQQFHLRALKRQAERPGHQPLEKLVNREENDETDQP